MLSVISDTGSNSSSIQILSEPAAGARSFFLGDQKHSTVMINEEVYFSADMYRKQSNEGVRMFYEPTCNGADTSS